MSDFVIVCEQCGMPLRCRHHETCHLRSGHRGIGWNPHEEDR